MPDIDVIITETLSRGSQLAGDVSEDFVLAVTAAYIVGCEAGKKAAQGAA